MSYGGLAPSPGMYGGAVTVSFNAILQSLLAGRGSAYNTQRGSVVWADCYATARSIWGMWETKQKVTNQFDPSRVTAFMSRWERIFGIVPVPGSTDIARRAVLVRKWGAIGYKMGIAGLNALARLVYPNIFAEIVNSTSSNALSHVYTSIAIPGGVTIVADGMWGSSIHNVAIRVVQPATMSDADFYKEAGQLNQWIEPLFPSYGRVHWFRYNSAGGLGILLGDPANMANEVFA